MPEHPKPEEVVRLLKSSSKDLPDSDHDEKDMSEEAAVDEVEGHDNVKRNGKMMPLCIAKKLEIIRYANQLALNAAQTKTRTLPADACARGLSSWQTCAPSCWQSDSTTLTALRVCLIS